MKKTILAVLAAVVTVALSVEVRADDAPVQIHTVAPKRAPKLRPHQTQAPVIRRPDAAGCETRELQGPLNSGTVRICG